MNGMHKKKKMFSCLGRKGVDYGERFRFSFYESSRRKKRKRKKEQKRLGEFGSSCVRMHESLCNNIDVYFHCLERFQKGED
jgi:hypothetical protein